MVYREARLARGVNSPGRARVDRGVTVEHGRCRGPMRGEAMQEDVMIICKCKGRVGGEMNAWVRKE
jgi:hypothetical protein